MIKLLTRTLVLSLLLLTLLSAKAEEITRQRLPFNDGWRFQKDDPAGTGDTLKYSTIKDAVIASSAGFLASDTPTAPAQADLGKDVSYTQPGFDDSAWRPLNLPHDWGIEGPFHQDYPGETGKLPWWGVAWYRKTFDVAEAEKTKQFFLQIDGAMSYSTVWLNGKFVGGWPYGYASYQLDLTPYLQPGKNVVSIRLENPDNSSRWYPGGGIYRNVWLLKTSPIHLAHWGVQITTPKVFTAASTVHIAARLADPKATAFLATSLFEADANGKKTGPAIAASRFPTGQKPDKTGALHLDLTVKTPKLWSLEKPSLYIAVTYVIAGGKIVDQEETTFGIRTIEFSADKGFLLNNIRVPLQGVCLHSDLGALGTAIHRRGLERQLEILKEMGCNAIRTSHNPPAPELLDLCDRLGILVMDEYADMWSEPKKPHGCGLLYADWHEKDLRAYIRRDRNHPSVILWSIGNEIPEQGNPKGIAEATELTGFAHEEDPTRPTTLACSSAAAGYSGIQNAVDVFGYNYKPGEYKKWRAANPQRPLFGSETASTISSRGEYFFPVSDKKGEGKSDFQISSYDLFAPGWATTPDVEFKGQDQNPSVAGEFVWTGFDYLGEPTPYNSDSTNLLNYHTPEAKAAAEKELQELGKISVPSRSSYFGILDLAGFKKDRFYLYQSRWRPDLPMAHILPHWNWAGREGQITPVHVYTSGDEAELFLNGQSLGRKKKGEFDYRLRWDDVAWQPGELKVVAYKKGQPWAEETIKTTGPAERLLATPDRTTLQADGSDLSYITITVADQGGSLVPASKNLLKFSLTGPGEIIATDNGDATDQTSFQSPERKAYNGLALVIIRTKAGQPGEIQLTAETAGLATATASLHSQ